MSQRPGAEMTNTWHSCNNGITPSELTPQTGQGGLAAQRGPYWVDPAARVWIEDTASALGARPFTVDRAKGPGLQRSFLVVGCAIRSGLGPK